MNFAKKQAKAGFRGGPHSAAEVSKALRRPRRHGTFSTMQAAGKGGGGAAARPQLQAEGALPNCVIKTSLPPSISFRAAGPLALALCELLQRLGLSIRRQRVDGRPERLFGAAPLVELVLKLLKCWARLAGGAVGLRKGGG